MSHTLREGHTLRVFENEIRRRIFGSKREEVTGGYEKMHNDPIKEDAMGIACTTHGRR
jgi:hypothetical protein